MSQFIFEKDLLDGEHREPPLLLLCPYYGRP